MELKTNITKRYFILAFVWFLATLSANAISRPDKEFKIFQFPQNQMPRIDGDITDWSIVPDSMAIGLNELMDTERGKGLNLDPDDFDVKVKVGWVKDLNRLYFLYEGFDDFWDFDRADLKNDIFELVVDADLSGGPFIKIANGNKNILSKSELHFHGHGAHAQNYHVFTPAEGKDWAMVWGNTPWIKEFPFANAAYNYSFNHGEGGKLIVEFWITPFEHADYRGPGFSTVSDLKENELIGLSWCILEYDNNENTFHSFMNLSHDTRMIKDASYLCKFKLLPLNKEFRKPVEADWKFSVIDMERRLVAFKDLSYGNITSWKWDFGDGTTSNEKNPIHQYMEPGEWVVVLYVEGPDGKERRSKVWDVVTR
jgi:hypothetical protein